MEQGYTIDRGHANAQQVGKWARGEPKPVKFLGISYTQSVKDRDLLPIVTWRCPRCGLLESYAR
jgi:hypothetical protein